MLPNAPVRAFKSVCFAIILIAICTAPARAGAQKTLENFIKTASTGRADFVQVVTAPAKAGQAARSKTSAGRFEFARPQRFRFSYHKPFEQIIVADGQTLWLFDVDLNQVSARNQAQALGATPAALLASATDLSTLQADFVLQDAPDRDGLQWLAATPKNPDGGLQTVRIGFKPTGDGSPAVLEMLDSFGQRSVLTFHHFEINPPLAAETFRFKPPAGADLLRQ